LVSALRMLKEKPNFLRTHYQQSNSKIKRLPNSTVPDLIHNRVINRNRIYLRRHFSGNLLFVTSQFIDVGNSSA